MNLVIFGARESCVITLSTLPGLRALTLEGSDIIGSIALGRKYRWVPFMKIVWKDFEVKVNENKVWLPTIYLLWPFTRTKY